MDFVCDASNGKTWFRIETEAEAVAESEMMKHAVEKYFRRERDKALAAWKPSQPESIERDIGRDAFVAKSMPLFLTLRANDGTALATAMLPPEGKDDPNFRMIIVGAANADPYPLENEAIGLLGKHFALTLSRERCFPYGK